MTKAQKQIVSILLKGGNISHLGGFGIRLRDSKQNPISKVHAKTFRWVRDLVKKRNCVYVISPKAVLQLRKNTWIRKEYKKLKNQGK